MMQDFEGMLEESRDIKLGFRYGQVRTLFEDDPRWKVRIPVIPPTPARAFICFSCSRSPSKVFVIKPGANPQTQQVGARLGSFGLNDILKPCC